MTAAYSVAFYADPDDLINGRPAAQIAYAALRETGGVEYERAREAIRRLIAADPYREHADDPDMDGGPGSRWARRRMYRIGEDDTTEPTAVAAFTIWGDTPRTRWWLTWSRDPDSATRILIHSLAPEPGSH